MVNLRGRRHYPQYRIIEKDAALERRMQPVKVDEPTVEETIIILKGFKNTNYSVKYADAYRKLLQICQSLHSRPLLTDKTVFWTKPVLR